MERKDYLNKSSSSTKPCTSNDFFCSNVQYKSKLLIGKSNEVSKKSIEVPQKKILKKRNCETTPVKLNAELVKLNETTENADHSDERKQSFCHKYLSKQSKQLTDEKVNSDSNKVNQDSMDAEMESMIHIRKDYHKTENPKVQTKSGLVRRDYYKADPPDAEKSMCQNVNENDKKEFYKYLGIDTKPSNERHFRPKETNFDIFKRRSLRVRYKNIQNSTKLNTAAECNSTLKIKNPDVSIDTTHKNNHEKVGLKTDGKLLENGDVKENKKHVSDESSEKLPSNSHKRKHNFTNESKVPVKYLFRSRISLGDTKLRSGKPRKEHFRAKYLSYFKNKHPMFRYSKHSHNKNSRVAKIKPKPKKQDAHKDVVVPLPKSPVSQLPDSTVNINATCDTEEVVQVSSSSNVTSEVTCTMKNPLDPEDGPVLFAYVVKEILICVQKDLVSFWRYSKFKYLVSIEQTWELLGRKRRYSYDTEIDVQNNRRLCFSEGTHPLYVELRARQLTQDVFRTCPLSSVYAVIYSINLKQPLLEWNKETVNINFVQLDSVQSSADDIHFTTIPGTRYFIVSWYEHLMQSKATGLCKYSITPDLTTLASIRELVHAKHNINDLKHFQDERLIGIGNTELSVWNHITGDLLMSIDFKRKLGLNLSVFEFKSQLIHCMFLIQLTEMNDIDTQSIDVLGVNFIDNSWKILKTHEIHLDPCKLTSISATSTSNIMVVNVGHGQSTIILSLNDFQLLMHKQRRSSDNVQVYFNDKHIIEIGNSIVTKSVDEYCIQL